MDNRARLLAAVDRILHDGGGRTISMREVARRADVSHALPGVLFGDRRGLLTAWAARAFEQLGGELDEAERRARSGQEALALTGRAYIGFGLSDPRRFELMFRRTEIDDTSAIWKSASQAAFSPLARAMHRAAAEAGMGDQERRVVSTAAWAMVHGYTQLMSGGHLFEGGQRPDPEQLSFTMTELFAARMLRRS